MQNLANSSPLKAEELIKDFELSKDVFDLVKPVEPHPLAKEAYQLIARQLKDVFGHNFEMNGQLVDLMALSIYFFSSVKDVHVMALTMIGCLWGFPLDDQLEKDPTGYPKWIKYLEEQSCPDTGKLEKLFLLMIKYKQLIEPKTVDAYINTLKDWLICAKDKDPKGLLAGFENMTDKEWMDYRMGDVAYDSQAIVLICANNLDVTDELKMDNDWIEFNKQASIHIILTNELFSTKKELKAGMAKYTYIYIKMKNKNFNATWQEVIDEIVTEAKESERLLLHHGDNLKALNNEQLDDFVNGIIQGCYGSAYWSTFCQRYNKL